MAADVPTTTPPAPGAAVTNESMTGLVTGIIHDAEQLLKQQFALLKHEVRDDMRKTALASAALVAGVVVLLYGALLVVVALPLLLAQYLPAVPMWAWFAIVGILICLVGGCMAYAGKKKFDSFNPLPDETAEALKENVQWITKPK
jgi:hypothetical protein